MKFGERREDARNTTYPDPTKATLLQRATDGDGCGTNLFTNVLKGKEGFDEGSKMAGGGLDVLAPIVDGYFDSRDVGNRNFSGFL